MLNLLVNLNIHFKIINMKKASGFLTSAVVLSQSSTQFSWTTTAKNAKAHSSESTSLAGHPLPGWYQHGKLGIFMHLGLYSKPVWAKGTKLPLAEIMTETAGEKWFANNPYAGWYYNSLRIKASSLKKRYTKIYGSNFSYFDSATQVDMAIKKLNAAIITRIIKDAGARYVVLTTKHCEDFLMGPGKTQNPFIRNYHAGRDIVGELTTAVRKQNRRAGTYYSSGLDWTFNPKAISNFPDLFQAVPQQQVYADYIDKHWNELINRCKPTLLWADIGSPTAYNPIPMITDYYNAVPNGIVKNRQKLGLTLTGLETTVPHDITAPEYQVLDSITKKNGKSAVALAFHLDIIKPKMQLNFYL